MTADDVARDALTDDDLAFLRYARFGELPPRVGPDDGVATTETEARRDLPEPEPQPPPYA